MDSENASDATDAGVDWCADHPWQLQLFTSIVCEVKGNKKCYKGKCTVCGMVLHKVFRA